MITKLSEAIKTNNTNLFLEGLNELKEQIKQARGQGISKYGPQLLGFIESEPRYLEFSLKDNVKSNFAEFRSWFIKIACAEGNLTICDRLEKAGFLRDMDFNVRFVNDKNTTLAHWPAKKGFYEILKWLQEKGVNLTQVDNEDKSPLDLSKAWAEKNLQLLPTEKEKNKFLFEQLGKSVQANLLPLSEFLLLLLLQRKISPHDISQHFDNERNSVLSSAYVNRSSAHINLFRNHGIKLQIDYNQQGWENLRYEKNYLLAKWNAVKNDVAATNDFLKQIYFDTLIHYSMSESICKNNIQPALDTIKNCSEFLTGPEVLRSLAQYRNRGELTLFLSAVATVYGTLTLSAVDNREYYYKKMSQTYTLVYENFIEMGDYHNAYSSALNIAMTRLDKSQFLKTSSTEDDYFEAEKYLCLALKLLERDPSVLGGANILHLRGIALLLDTLARSLALSSDKIQDTPETLDRLWRISKIIKVAIKGLLATDPNCLIELKKTNQIQHASFHLHESIVLLFSSVETLLTTIESIVQKKSATLDSHLFGIVRFLQKDSFVTMNDYLQVAKNGVYYGSVVSCLTKINMIYDRLDLMEATLMSINIEVIKGEERELHCFIPNPALIGKPTAIKPESAQPKIVSDFLKFLNDASLAVAKDPGSWLLSHLFSTKDQTVDRSLIGDTFWYQDHDGYINMVALAEELLAEGFGEYQVIPPIQGPMREGEPNILADILCQQISVTKETGQGQKFLLGYNPNLSHYVSGICEVDAELNVVIKLSDSMSGNAELVRLFNAIASELIFVNSVRLEICELWKQNNLFDCGPGYLENLGAMARGDKKPRHISGQELRQEQRARFAGTDFSERHPELRDKCEKFVNRHETGFNEVASPEVYASYLKPENDLTEHELFKCVKIASLIYKLSLEHQKMILEALENQATPTEHMLALRTIFHSIIQSLDSKTALELDKIHFDQLINLLWEQPIEWKGTYAFDNYRLNGDYGILKQIAQFYRHHTSEELEATDRFVRTIKEKVNSKGAENTQKQLPKSLVWQFWKQAPEGMGTTEELVRQFSF